MNNIEKLLVNLGFNESEAKTYTALLEHGELKIAQLAHISGLKRTLIYHTTKRLMESGLVIEIKKGKHTYFRTTNPETLNNLVESKKRLAKQDSDLLEDLMPVISQKYTSTGERPLVDIYAGISGLEKIYKLILLEADELLIFASTFARRDPIVDKLITKQILLQEKAGITVRSVVKNILENEREYFLKDVSIQIKVLPAKEFLSETQVFIWKDTVALNTVGDEMVSTIIRNKKIADTFRIIFNALWSRLSETETTSIETKQTFTNRKDW